ncbi:MAG: glucose 1-dehydrogenase [Planctomycetes bacterium]|nr:glucose 1-dehydrogenase [Planctomycetota bacterium]
MSRQRRDGGRLPGKVAIVTGGGQGIGRGIAMAFAREGAQVVVANRTAEKGQETVALIEKAGGEATFIRTDIRDESDARNLVTETIARYGKLDVLCNNAGIGLLRSVVESSEEEYYRVMDTNVKGAFLVCKYAIPEMIRRGGGSIINLASVASYVAFRRDAAYCASKGALLMLTKQMALDYAPHKIRVNAICPGFVVTPELEHYIAQQEDPARARQEIEQAHPLGVLGTPEDIGNAAVYLASDESRWVTGLPLIIDGGLMLD